MVFITAKEKGVTDEQKEEVVNKFNSIRSEIAEENVIVELNEASLEKLTEEEWSKILTEIAKKTIKESKE